MIVKYLGVFLSFLWKLAVLGFTATETYLLFHDFTPISSPWLPFFALAVCEYGILKWSHWTKHNALGPAQHTMGFVMVCISCLAVVSTTVIQLIRQMSGKGYIDQTPLIAQFAIYFLIFVFACNIFCVPLKDFLHPVMLAHFKAVNDASPQHDTYHEDVRTTPHVTEPITLLKSAKIDAPAEDVRTTQNAQPAPQKRTLIPAGVKRYMSGQPLTGIHGRDCICSSCRPDMHQEGR